MQANWSLILNILLLTGVVVAIVRMLRTKRMAEASVYTRPSVGMQPVDKNSDEIIAVRKITREAPVMQANFSSEASSSSQKPVINSHKFGERFQATSVSKPVPPVLNRDKPSIGVVQAAASSPVADLDQDEKIIASDTIESKSVKQEDASPKTLVIFLLAKENRQLAGYELLQTILAAGLRFGEGHLFHRHQYPNGQGPVLCSLATATAGGVFDLQNIGAFSVHGLCLFMQTSGNASIDLERFSIMVDTAKQLSEGLDTYMLDDERKAWTDLSEVRYERLFNVEETADVADA